VKRETRHEQTLRLAINGLKVTSPVKTILHAIVAEVEGAWRDSDARLRAELRRKGKALRYIHDNTECLLSHETARGALKKPQ